MLRPSSICLFLLLVFLGRTQAQEQLGIRLDNYAGINSIILNPAGHMHSPNNWDVNLGEIGQFTFNNYIHFENSSLVSLINNEEPYVYGPNNLLRDQPAQGLTLNYKNNSADRFGAGTTTILGPSFYVRINEKHTLGLMTRFRMAASVSGVPNELSYYKFNSQIGRAGFIMDRASSTLLTWGEIGLNYLYQKETIGGKLGIGITLKSLQGYEAAFVFNETPLEIAKFDKDVIQSSAGSVQYAYTNTILRLTDDDYMPTQNGSGISLDLGVSYALGASENDSYLLKLGFSILDLGYIKFDKNAELHRAQSSTDVIFGGNEYKEFNELQEWDDALEYFSFQIMGDSSASLTGNDFSFWLPTAFSLQADYQVLPGIYLNGTLVTGIPLARNAPNRFSLLAFTPRIESRWLSIATPLSLYNLQKVRMGLGLKLGWLYLGSDDVLSIFQRQKEFSGTDFYLGLKVTPFGKGAGGRAKGGRGGKNSDDVRCYRF